MHSDKIKNFLHKKREANQSGGEDKILSQHEKGKLTARERIDLLLDEGSFTEIDALSDIFYHNQLASGVIPQITASIGPSAGGAVYSPAMTDFVIMVDKLATMFVTGPEVVKTVLGEEVSFDELGGAMSHAKNSGVAHFVAKNEYQCMDYVKTLLSFIPQNNTEEPPLVMTSDDPNRLDSNLINIIPENQLQPYDIKEIF